LENDVNRDKGCTRELRKLGERQELCEEREGKVYDFEGSTKKKMHSIAGYEDGSLSSWSH